MVVALEKSNPGLTNFKAEGGGMRRAKDDIQHFSSVEKWQESLPLLLPSEPVSSGEQGLDPGSGELNLLALSKRAQTVTSVAL